MMAATIRGTPNFGVPPTQNTAPVDEFRCLYTHDIRKKQKKWHDGTVKFHTFNRRVMVYDDSRNYVGDLHYRADEHFGEGVELQLDRGVMVEVGEPLGQTQTDVTALVSRGQARGETTAVSTTSATPQSIKRVNTVDAQGRPKSLAEVLGASQGRLGRARLPIQSPFEQRQGLEESPPKPPPPKKQKVVVEQCHSPHVQQPASRRAVSGKENISVQTKAPLRKRVVAEKSTFPQPKVSAARDVVASSARPDQPSTLSSVVDLSSDDEMEVEMRHAGNQPSSSRRNDILPKAMRAGQTELASASKSQQNLAGKRPKKNDQAAPVRQAAVRPPTVSPALNGARSDGQSRPSSKQGSGVLKFAATSKPRPKLMYRALLPTSTIQTATRIGAQHSSRQRGVNIDIGTTRNASVEVPNEDYADIESLLELDAAHVDVDTVNSLPRQSSSAQETPERNRPSRQPPPLQSPLFVSQAESQQLLSSPSLRIPEDDSFDMSFTQELSNLADPNVSGFHSQELPKSKVSTPKSGLSTPSLSPVIVTGPVTAEQSPSPIGAEEMTKPIPRPVLSTAQQPNLLSSTTRPFRRIVSEGDSTILQNPIDTTTTTSTSSPNLNLLSPNTTTTHLPNPQPDPAPFSHRSPTKPNPIQRSFSDTQAIIPQPLEIETADTTLKSTEEQGPWTKLEAYLLFETWPASKRDQKPVFERAVGVEDGDGDGDGDEEVEMYKGNVKGMGMGRFRSARLVLRDEE